MSNQMEIYLPPPTNWQDFQRLVEEIAAVRYKPATVVPYARQGQRQFGVDVYAEEFSGEKIGIQCKETKKSLTEAIVRAEADEAVNFPQKLNVFIVATTESTDGRLQDAVAAINNAKVYPFTLRLEFWDMLVNQINRYALVLNSCYRTYRDAAQQSDESRHLGCLRVAFDRPAFKDDFLNERNYLDFEDALVTTKQLFRTGLGRDRLSKIPIVQTIPIDSLPDGRYRRFVFSLEQQLESIYRMFIADRKQILADSQYAKERAGQYNIVRRELLIKLNDKLKSDGLPEIDYSYR